MKIGNRKVVYTSSLIIPEGEDAWIFFDVGDWHVKVNLIFNISDEENENGAISIEGIDDHAKVTFFNWNNSLGTVTVNPVELGKTNEGKRLTFMASHWLIGRVNKIDVQFLIGEDG